MNDKHTAAIEALRNIIDYFDDNHGMVSGALIDQASRAISALEQSPPDADALDARSILLSAFDQEIERVSHLEYDSNVICRHFFEKLLERFDAAMAQENKP